MKEDFASIFGELNKAKNSFYKSHDENMKTLHSALDSLKHTTREEDTENSKHLKEIDNDLDKLLED